MSSELIKGLLVLTCQCLKDSDSHLNFGILAFPSLTCPSFASTVLCWWPSEMPFARCTMETARNFPSCLFFFSPIYACLAKYIIWYLFFNLWQWKSYTKPCISDLIAVTLSDRFIKWNPFFELLAKCRVKFWEQIVLLWDINFTLIWLITSTW